MSRSKTFKAIVSLLCAPLILGFQNCSNVKLTMPEKELASTGVSGQFCVSGSITRYGKVVFIMDKSGSNQKTDTTNRRRTSLLDFYEKTKDNEFMKYSLISFQGSGAKSYISNSSDAGISGFGDADQFLAGIEKMAGEPDADATPYLAALDKAKTIIQAELAQKPDEVSMFNIFFVTDGLPTDIDVNGAPAESAHFDKVTDLRNLDPSHIILSTIYYGPPNDGAVSGLQTMAQRGGGQFVDLGANQNIDFTKILAGPQKESWILRQFLVYNLSSAFCEDGTVGADSDSDGLCDKDELAFNSRFAGRLADSTFKGKKFDPYDRNSFDADYSDLFVFKSMVLATGSGLESCADKTQKEFDILNSCEKQMLKSDNPTARTPQWTDYLVSNGKTGNINTPDTDGDGIVDSVALFTYHLFSAALNYNNLTQIYSGYSGEKIYEEHRHFRNPTGNPAANYDTKLIPTGYNDLGESCYTVTQDRLPLYPTAPISETQASGSKDLAHNQNENVVLVYYIAVPEKDPNGRRLAYKYSYQKLQFRPGMTNATAHDLNFDKFQTFEASGH